MEWKKLLQPYRLGCPKIIDKDIGRNEFQRDFDRIIFSTAFRRLQGKTQVFPFPETDTIHTRLTHSLEAASVGRSLGTIVGKELKNKYNFINEWELGSLVSVACLAHDIGNPPFGHSGETAISEYFKSKEGEKIIEGLSDIEKADFTEFEGNALGFHILTHSNKNVTNVSGGLALTLPALGAYCKYPRPSYYPYKNKKAISEKKPGLFTCDIEVYENEIAETLGIEKKNSKDGWFRYPLAFLNEAADDICYTINDFEDGYRHRIISYEIIKELFSEIAEAFPKKSNINNIKKIINEADKIGYLRAKAINSLAYQVGYIFIENEEKILNCEFDQQLCDLIKSKLLLDEIIKLSIEKIYSYRTVLQVETAGFQIISGLLNIFLFALKDKGECDKKEIKCRESSIKILKLLPKQYLWDYNKERYDSILNITGYIAGMTDNFAVDTYRNLSGIQLPNY